jgi:hypothetical protein
MKTDLKPAQAFLIFSMMFGETDAEREPKFADAPIDKKPRDELKKAGFVDVQKRGRSSHIVLEDKAWDWAASHLDHELPNTAKAAKVLRVVLRKLGTTLDATDRSLADFVREAKAIPALPTLAPEPPDSSDGDLEDEVREACLDLTHGAPKQRVRLTDLRRRVSAPRDALDAALTAMQRAGRLVLFKIENPAELTPADESAALYIAGNPRHLVYLEA